MTLFIAAIESQFDLFTCVLYYLISISRFFKIDELIGNKSDQYLHNLKTKYFGKKNSLNLHETKKFLERKLNT